MSIFKNHRHKTNIALAALTSLCVISAVTALSVPYWVSSTSILAPLAVFAATPLGISVLVFVAVALVSLAIYSIIKNNDISEPKASRIVIRSNEGDLFAKVKDEDFEYIKTHNQNKNQDGSVISDEYRIDFNFGSNSYYITAAGKEMDNNDVLLRINSVGRKNDKGEYELIHKDKEKLKTLGLGAEENDAKRLTIEFVPSSILKSLEVKHEEPEKLLNN
ncbi:hypothetical protein Wcon_00866 [Wolbachia endosymbiont of Cylisticus convexus]|uniref:hypothetical protein n=1 Tax=Wolbachia endosymbiont of Cylisticus convexus TaxID=118728 RepID=UPI000DF6CAF0|nr:hypothetical protein [Wolbachia endosymbiont of Cylisticus convexus]RDD35018.1 hypothetical protein Wcon_00866 [Wolbachia endosymbiont of Cylisticus convexus]